MMGERAVQSRASHNGEPPGDVPEQRSRLFGTDRLAAFSDGVLSITITLLVVEITRPDQPGRLLAALLEQWPTYVALLASFGYVGFTDHKLQLANLFLLLTVALIPFPTAVLSTALQGDDPGDARIAVVLYALIAGVMCLSWLVLFQYLRRRPHLLQEDVDPTSFQAERLRAWLGIAGYAIAGVLGWAVEPLIALLIFLGLPVFYGLTSEGLAERHRPQ